MLHVSHVVSRDAEGVHLAHLQNLHRALQLLILAPKYFMVAEGTGLEVQGVQFLPLLKGKQNTFLKEEWYSARESRQWQGGQDK